MEIERYRSHDNKILNRPLKKYLHLFLHCSNGKSSVTTRELNSIIWPMLNIHGINHMTIIDKTNKIKRKKEHKGRHHFMGASKICKFCGHSKYYAQSYNIKCSGKMAW